MVEPLPCWRCGKKPDVKSFPNDHTAIHCKHCKITVDGVRRWNRYARKLGGSAVYEHK